MLQKKADMKDNDKRKYIEFILQNINEPKIWDDEPVFCFTADIDFASEYVLEAFFNDLPLSEIKLTIFVTHHSEVIKEQHRLRKLDRGIHPNFLSNSSHGNSFNEIINYCISIAPEAQSYRAHRLFEVTDTAHNLFENKGFKYSSNTTAILNDRLKPLLHESGIINFPIFFEDGTHLYNELDLDIKKYINHFICPGLKVISFHPMNYIINTPEIDYMRKIKSTLSRNEYNQIDESTVSRFKYHSNGIRNVILQIMELSKKHKIFSLKECYNIAIRKEGLK